MRVTSLVETMRKVGLRPTQGGRWAPCPACSATSGGRTDKRGAVRLFGDPPAWRCSSCDAGGDNVTLAAWHLRGMAPPAKGDPSWADPEWREVLEIAGTASSRPGAVVAACTRLQITVTIFDALDRPKGRRAVWSWPALASRISRPKPMGDRSKADLPLLTLATFTGDYRRGDRLQLLYGLALDYDGFGDLDRDTLLKWWGRWAFMAHTTASHGLAKGDEPPGARWRVIVPLENPLSGATYRRVVKAIISTERGRGLDPASATPAQAYHAPARTSRYQSIVHEGPVLDAHDLLLADHHAPAEPSHRSKIDRWPELDQAAFHGLAGRAVETIEPHTEADPVALLVQVLLAFGSIVNRAPHFRVGGDRHSPNLFAVLVGATSSGRKGTSWGEVRRLLKPVAPEWAANRVLTGLSSGEGVIHAVRDTSGQDEGVADKRLLVMEPELAKVLNVMGREGNTLSATIRSAWETGTLGTLTKAKPERATEAHVSIVAHVTKTELLKRFRDTEAANGFGNRFLWVAVRRSKLLPDGGTLEDRELLPLVHEFQRARARAVTQLQPFTRSEGARELWHAVYGGLSTRPPGLFGAITARAAPQVLRLSLLYALLDADRPQNGLVDTVHLKAALALWRYCEDSARYVFGTRLGDPIADRIRAHLEETGKGATRTNLRDLFHRRKSGAEITRALVLLRDTGLARCDSTPTGGRPAERWHSTSA